jgi:hypothetical protein
VLEIGIEFLISISIRIHQDLLRSGYTRAQVKNWFCNRRYCSREGKAARAAQAQEKSSARGVGASYHLAGGGSCQCQCQCLCIAGRQGSDSQGLQPYLALYLHVHFFKIFNSLGPLTVVLIPSSSSLYFPSKGFRMRAFIY